METTPIKRAAILLGQHMSRRQDQEMQMDFYNLQ